MMGVRFLVVFQCETAPWEVFMYEEEADARAKYDDLTTSWTGVFLCRVLRDGSRPSDEQPEAKGT